MTTNRNGKMSSLGSIVEALFDQARTVASEDGAVADIAAHRLEQVLVRGANARLAAALSDLALELAPVHSNARWVPKGCASTSSRAA